MSKGHRMMIDDNTYRNNQRSSTLNNIMGISTDKPPPSTFLLKKMYIDSLKNEHSRRPIKED